MWKKVIDKTFLKFLLVGAANTLFGTAVMFFFYNVWNCNYWVSTAANYFFGSTLSYFLNKYFTFKNREKDWRQVMRFIINILCCYLLAYGIAKPVMTWALSGFSRKVQENGAMLAGMMFFVIINYFGQRFFTFREEGKGGCE